MSIKNDRVDFEKLLNGVDPVGPVADNAAGSTSPSNAVKSVGQEQTAAVVDNASSADLMETKLFEFNYDEERKIIKRRCRKTVTYIMEHIMPEDMRNEPYVQNKVEQDTETLTGLYMQTRLNEVMQRSMVEQTSRGMYSARNNEVFGQLSTKIQEINKQIVDTEQKLRKTYVDLKFEIQESREERREVERPVVQTITGPTAGGGVIVTSPKSIMDAARNKKIEAYKNAKDTKAEVVE